MPKKTPNSSSVNNCRVCSICLMEKVISENYTQTENDPFATVCDKCKENIDILQRTNVRVMCPQCCQMMLPSDFQPSYSDPLAQICKYCKEAMNMLKAAGVTPPKNRVTFTPIQDKKSLPPCQCSFCKQRDN